MDVRTAANTAGLRTSQIGPCTASKSWPDVVSSQWEEGLCSHETTYRARSTTPRPQGPANHYRRSRCSRRFPRSNIESLDIADIAACGSFDLPAFVVPRIAFVALHLTAHCTSLPVLTLSTSFYPLVHQGRVGCWPANTRST